MFAYQPRTTNDCLRHLYYIHDFLDNVFRSNVFSFRLVGDDNAVAENVERDSLHVLRYDITAPLNEGVRLGRLCQVHRGAG